MDYLIESDFFKENINSFFNIDEKAYGDFSLFHSRKKFEKNSYF